MSLIPRIPSAASGGRVPCTSPVNVNEDTTATLRQQLIDSKAETQKVTDQLNCLILLVKRAWLGDKAAAIHVGNIVGIKSPHGDDANMKVTFTPKTKYSRAMNNWMLLTAALLNKEYATLEAATVARQQAYLHGRKDFLEEQLIHHRDLRAREPLGLKRTVTDVDKNFINSHNRVKSASSGSRERIQSAGVNRSRPPVKSLLHSPQDCVIQSDMTLADLVIDSSSHDNVMNGLYRLSSQNYSSAPGVREGFDPSDPDRAVISYDNPRRYSAGSAYEVNCVVGEKSLKTRPTSGKLQKKSDNMRARPKSAAVSAFGKSERPLRYETTRPISAFNSKHPPREKSLDKTSSKTSISNDSEKKPAMRVKIQRPDFVVDYENDVQKMNDMEEDFKRTALMLQKKLGINDAGTVY